MRIGEILGIKLDHFNPFEPSIEVVRQHNIGIELKQKRQSLHSKSIDPLQRIFKFILELNAQNPTY